MSEDGPPCRGRAVGCREKVCCVLEVLCRCRRRGSRFLAKLIVLGVGLRVGVKEPCLMFILYMLVSLQ